MRRVFLLLLSMLFLYLYSFIGCGDSTLTNNTPVPQIGNVYKGYVYAPLNNGVGSGKLLVIQNSKAPSGYKGLSGAKVEIINSGNYQITDPNGLFIFQALNAGLLNFKITHNDYQTFLHETMVEEKSAYDNIPIKDFKIIPSHDIVLHLNENIAYHDFFKVHAKNKYNQTIQPKFMLTRNSNKNLMKNNLISINKKGTYFYTATSISDPSLSSSIKVIVTDQIVTVSGKVFDGNLDVVSGVLVTVKESSQSNVTGIDGTYKIDTPYNNTLTICAYIGNDTAEQTVTLTSGQTGITVDFILNQIPPTPTPTIPPTPTPTVAFVSTFAPTESNEIVRVYGFVSGDIKFDRVSEYDSSGSNIYLTNTVSSDGSYQIQLTSDAGGFGYDGSTGVGVGVWSICFYQNSSGPSSSNSSGILSAVYSIGRSLEELQSPSFINFGVGYPGDDPIVSYFFQEEYVNPIQYFRADMYIQPPTTPTPQTIMIKKSNKF